MTTVNNAIILAAGKSSRFDSPLPKGLTKIKGETLIERQIKQLREVGVNDIYVVVGYKKEEFEFLKDLGVKLIENKNYETENNVSSILVVKDLIGNSYICNCDNYYENNPFYRLEFDPFYAVKYVEGPTDEWCVTTDGPYIKDIKIGGKDSYVMIGHSFWTYDFRDAFLVALDKGYDKTKVWEDVMINNLDRLKMKIRVYRDVYEFDTLEEFKKCAI